MDKAVIYEAGGADPARDRIVRETPDGRIIVVVIPDSAEAEGVAAELVDAGVRLIELCGGITPIVRAGVTRAVGDRALVSSVAFGPESLTAGAAYSSAFDAGKPPREAFLILDRAAADSGERTTRAFPPQSTDLIFVPDTATAVRVARDLVEEGFGLIELYGGFSTDAAASIIETVDGKAPVGVGSFALDAVVGNRA